MFAPPHTRPAARVLVVDDDRVLLLALTARLRQSGYRVDGLRGASLALGAVAKHQYDLVIIDLGLSGTQGLAVIRRLRVRLGEVPMLVISARHGLDDRVSSLDAGADAYVVKPFDMPELEARVRAFIRRRRADLEGTFYIGDVELVLHGGRIRAAGLTVDLPVREFAVLHILLTRTGGQQGCARRAALPKRESSLGSGHHVLCLSSETAPRAPEAQDSHVAWLRISLGGYQRSSVGGDPSSGHGASRLGATVRVPRPAGKGCRRQVGPRAQPTQDDASALGGLPTFYLLTRPAIYFTEVGKQLTQKLSDGSVIELNTNSLVSVDYTLHRRNVRLDHGEAYFSVKHDPARPFTVTSPDTQITAVGTEFNVRLKPHSTALTVFKGKVRVSTMPPPDIATTRPARPSKATREISIEAGAMADITAGAPVTPIANEDAGVASWRTQLLEFENTPLDEVIDEFNRYNRDPILVEGTATHNVRLTTAVKLHDPEGILGFARQQKGWSVAQEGKSWIIRTPDQ